MTEHNTAWKEHATRTERRARWLNTSAARSNTVPAPGDPHLGNPVGAPKWLQRRWRAE